MHLSNALPILAVLLLAAGCATPGVEPPKDAQGRFVITMTEYRFDPPDARVPAGATVVWVNNGTTGHDVHGHADALGPAGWGPSIEDAPEPGSTAYPNPGERYIHTFTADESGTWTVWCHTHHEQDMKAILHVG